MIITEREIPRYYREIRDYLSPGIREIAPDIGFLEMDWGFKVDKSSYPAVRFEIETDVCEDKARLVKRTRVDGPVPRRVQRFPDETYDLREGILPVCEYVLGQLREAQALTDSVKVQI